MTGCSAFFILSCLFVFVVSKELHEKQTLEAKNKDDQGFINLFNNQDSLNKNDRYVRHVKAVTESVLDHLFNEIKHHYYSPKYNPNSPITRLMKNLNKELKRKEKSKIKKEKKNNKNKKSKRRRIKTTTDTY